MARVLTRTRRSFLARHKRTISHGFITADTDGTNLSHSGLGVHHGHVHSASLDGSRHHQLYRARSPLVTELDGQSSDDFGGRIVETPVATGLTDDDEGYGERRNGAHGRELREHHLSPVGRLSKDGADSLNRTDTTSAGSVADGGEEEAAALRKAAAMTGDRPTSSRRRSLLRVFRFGGN